MSDKPAAAQTATPNCLVRSLTTAFAADHTLEAVTISRAHDKISVATLGRTDESALAARVTATVQEAENDFPCGLLEGREECETCTAPLSPAERQSIIIKREGDTTTIARVTCVTAPRFWRWRDIPFPKFIQRDVEMREA